MTSQPPPVPDEVRSASQYLRPVRDNAVYVLLAADAVMLFVAIIHLIPSGSGPDFGTRSMESFYTFVGVPAIAFPLAAVLLAVLVRPRHPRARLIVLVALGEYAVSAFFGLLFGFLIGLVKIGTYSGRTTFEELLLRVSWLAVFGIAAYATVLIWRNVFHTARPQPGLYGQPGSPRDEPPIWTPPASHVPPATKPMPAQEAAGDQPGGNHSYDALNEPTMVVPQQQDQGEAEKPRP